jgi:2-iminobutanoate/2-iminopropanoate deaminase
MLDPAGKDVALERPELVRHSVDDESLHPAQDDPELLVLVAVQRHGRVRLELDQVQHRALSEQGPAAHARREVERADGGEVDELRLHGAPIILAPMAEREEIRVAGQAEPISHYTDAVRAGDLLFVSGVVPVDSEGRLVGGDDVVAQARQTLANVGAVLAAAGATFADVAKVTIYLTDIADRPRINPVRREAFGTVRPASTLVEVGALAVPGAKIEIEAVAVLQRSRADTVATT